MAKPTIKLKKPTFTKPKLATFTSFRTLVSAAILVGVILLAGAGYVWFKNILTDPNRVFYGMIDKNLETDSVVRVVSQPSSSKSIEQSYYMSYTPALATESLSTIEQVGQDRQTSKVITRSIGTKDTDFVKYEKIDIPSGPEQGDYSKLVNQWAKREKNPETGEAPQFLNEASFMFVPFGNLSHQDRDKLVKIMKDKKIYKIKKTSQDLSNGRATMDMEVDINPEGLITMLAEYVKITGLGDASQLNPDDYKETPDVSVNMNIDMLSRHLRSIKFAGDTTRVETYSAYGINREIKIPTNTISIEELQNRLQPSGGEADKQAQ
jgi:hypothetical protein